MVCCMNFAHADYVVYLSTPDACETISGDWKGTGNATNWLIGNCRYHGRGTVSKTDNAGNFTVRATADKESGSFLCPAHATEQLTGICVNGVAKIMTEYGNLSGNFSNNSGNVKGHLLVEAGMSIDVLAEFFRDV